MKLLFIMFAQENRQPLSQLFKIIFRSLCPAGCTSTTHHLNTPKRKTRNSSSFCQKKRKMLFSFPETSPTAHTARLSSTSEFSQFTVCLKTNCFYHLRIESMQICTVKSLQIYTEWNLQSKTQ